MQLIRTVDAMQSHADAVRQSGTTLALVPTMGALHDGHLALVRDARTRADHVVVSIFVNPTQFGPEEDFDEYPRTLDADREKLGALGVDVVFAPTVEEMYPHAHNEDLPGPVTWVTVDRLTDTLCGAYRDGHFRGVTTVVTKLFHACKPHVAVFGTKDAQQYVTLQRMVDELLFDIDVVGVETVREDDGLAQSSRNQYLSDAHRRQAPVLHSALQRAERRVLSGEQDPQAVVEAMRDELDRAPDANVQYARIVDAHTLQPLDALQPGRDVLVALAVFFGDTRLIDNVFVHVPAAEE